MCTIHGYLSPWILDCNIHHFSLSLVNLDWLPQDIKQRCIKLWTSWINSPSGKQLMVNCWWKGPGGLGFESGYTQGCQSLSCSGIPGIQATNPNQHEANILNNTIINSPSLKLTASLPRNIKGWKIFTFSFGMVLFSRGFCC